MSRAVGELVEVQDQTAEPFVVDSSKDVARPGVIATPLGTALEQTSNATGRRRPSAAPACRSDGA